MFSPSKKALNFIPIENQYGETLAVSIKDYDFHSESIPYIISLISKYGILIFKNTNCSVKKYYEWQLELGYHQFSKMWCVHKQYPIFTRVTNKEVENGKKGLFANKEMNWHCSTVLSPDGCELLGLYGLLIPDHPVSKTFFVNSIPYFKNLSPTDKKNLNGIYIGVAHKSEQTYEKKNIIGIDSFEKWHVEENRKTARSIDIRKSLNFDKRNYDSYLEPRYFYGQDISLRKNFLKLVPDHPLDIKGLYFPYFKVYCLAGSDKNELSNSRELFEKIKQDWIFSGRYIYEHKWEEGDVVLADQLTGLHKRNNIWQEANDLSLKRELLRSVCWYKTKYRKHFKRTI